MSQEMKEIFWGGIFFSCTSQFLSDGTIVFWSTPTLLSHSTWSALVRVLHHRFFFSESRFALSRFVYHYIQIWRWRWSRFRHTVTWSWKVSYLLHKWIFELDGQHLQRFITKAQVWGINIKVMVSCTHSQKIWNLKKYWLDKSNMK